MHRQTPLETLTMSPEQTVLKLLHEELCPPDVAIREEGRLVADLHLDGDDYGMHLVPALERALDIKPAIEEWESIITVGDLIRLASRHVAMRRQGR